MFLDIEKAFDKVWYEGFSYKLTALIPIEIVKIIELHWIEMLYESINYNTIFPNFQ